LSEITTPQKFDWTPFHCDVMSEGDVVHVRPFGELDIATTPQVAAPLDETRADGHRKVVLDLAGLTFVDSSGMRAIVEAHHAAARHGIEFAVLPGPPAVQRAFEVAGLAELLFSP
jgi:anti-sigma B factor antagonist